MIGVKLVKSPKVVGLNNPWRVFLRSKGYLTFSHTVKSSHTLQY